MTYIPLYFYELKIVFNIKFLTNKKKNEYYRVVSKKEKEDKNEETDCIITCDVC